MLKREEVAKKSVLTATTDSIVLVYSVPGPAMASREGGNDDHTIKRRKSDACDVLV